MESGSREMVELPVPTGDGDGGPLGLGDGDRLLVVAPHPDDESIAVGGLLQHALAAGAALRVLYLTDGGNNPWAQRASERRLSIGEEDRRRFGDRRRAEAMAALEALGAPLDCTRFLGLPDQGLTDLLLEAGAATRTSLATELLGWRPTHVVSPSPADLHPDHSAAAVLTRLALRETGEGERPMHFTYLVHNPRLRRRGPGRHTVLLSDEERERKRRAILCHRTQAVLRGPWLRAFATRRESLNEFGDPAEAAGHPVRPIGERGGDMLLGLRSLPRPTAFGRRTLAVLLAPAGGEPRALRLPLPFRSGTVAVRDWTTGRARGRTRFDGGPWAGRLAIPADLLPAGADLFAKLEHRFGFFDAAGWLELERTGAREQR
jgi:LmbE family N-acetylglucosaminyl deacetylase